MCVQNFPTGLLSQRDGDLPPVSPQVVNKSSAQSVWKPSNSSTLSHPSTIIPSRSPREQAPQPNLLHLFSPRHCNTGVFFFFDSCMTVSREGNRQHHLPSNSFDLALVLTTSTPRRLYLRAREQRQQENRARSSLKQGWALFPEQ